MSHDRGNCLIGIFILVLAFLLVFADSALCQTADGYFELGKADLENSSLAPANANFQLALSLDPNHEGANLFYALTSILMVSSSSEFNTLLDRAGVSATGRNVFEWDPGFTRDAYGHIILPADSPTGKELQSFAHGYLLPVVAGAIDKLGKVGSSFQTDFDWTFDKGQGGPSGVNAFVTYTGYWYTNEWVGYRLVVGGSEYTITANTDNLLTVSGNLALPVGTYDYRIVTPVEIDYGDVLVFRGGLNAVKAGILISSAFNVDVDIDAIVSQLDTAEFDIQTDVIQVYPQLLTLLPTNQMAEGKGNLRDSIAQLTAAVNFIVAESDPQGNDFFVINAEEGARFSATLAEWNNALNGPAFVESLNTQVDLTQLFDNPRSLRDYLPRFDGTLIRRGSFRDPTFGGILPSMSATELYRLLERVGVLTPIDAIDFDGDGRSDLTVWRPSSGMWYTLVSGSPGSFTGTQWGARSDLVAPGDYDGDGKQDIAVWRPGSGFWYWLPSGSPGTYKAIQWGAVSDVPVRGDYLRDGTEDLGVWRPTQGMWFVLLSEYIEYIHLYNIYVYIDKQWGVNGDIPVPADYDGDKYPDIAVWRPANGVWYVLPTGSAGAYTSIQWGVQGDVPVPGDYDADGRADIAVWRRSAGVWFIMPSGSPGTYTATQWGLPSDTPTLDDYDGDGRADVGVWRPSNGVWYVLPSGLPGTFTATQWGMAGDEPISRLTAILHSMR